MGGSDGCGVFCWGQIFYFLWESDGVFVYSPGGEWGGRGGREGGKEGRGVIFIHLSFYCIFSVFNLIYLIYLFLFIFLLHFI